MDAPIRVNLTVDQLLDAIRSLPKQAQIVVQQAIAEGLDRDEVRRRAREAIDLIRAANKAYSPDEVWNDVNLAIAEVRAEYHAARSG